MRRRRTNNLVTSRFAFFLLLIVVLSYFLLAHVMRSTSGIVTSNEIQGKVDRTETNKQHSSSSSAAAGLPVKIAHAVTLTHCPKGARSGKIGGILDPLRIMRHAIHRTSVHHESSGSKYSYQMFAFAGESCQRVVPSLEALGYITYIADTPINVDEITHNDYYKTAVKEDGCCGEKEFIKLQVLNLTDYPVVVNWDLDTLILRPLDEAFDVMLHDKDSAVGKAARQSLEIERPKTQRYPSEDIEFLYTIAELNGMKHSPVNGGFLMFRTSEERLIDIMRIIMQANYTKEAGWGNMGYGGDGNGSYQFPGGMTIQGFMGYYYEQIYKGHSLELDNCRWNQSSKKMVGDDDAKTCSKYPPEGVTEEDNTLSNGMCEDCTTVPFEQMRTVHFQMGRKPWYCQLKFGEDNPWRSMTPYIQEYFKVRRDLEDQIAQARGVEAPTYNGKFHPETFLGYCDDRPDNPARGNLVDMPPLPDGFDMSQVYGF